MLYQVIYFVGTYQNEYTELIEADAPHEAEIIALSRLKREHNTDKVFITDIWERGEINHGA